MRLIVVGQVRNLQGLQQINVWFRFPVVGASRIAYYQKAQGGYVPQALGDYSGADSAEVAAFQNGTYLEGLGFFDMIDPLSTVAQIQARLVSLYNTAKAANKAADDTLLADAGSAWDGTTWTMKSA
jgi:hypothetical protein